MEGKLRLLLALFSVLAFLLLVACGDSQDGGGNSTESGEKLFKEALLAGAAGCKTCHSLEPDTIIVGPSLAGVATRAESMVPGQSAEDYLRTAILEPDDYLVPGYPASVMPNVWNEQLSDEQIDSLVGYLITLK